MGMDWGDYVPFDRGFAGRPLDELDRETAELHFSGLMEDKEQHKRCLAQLVRHSGGFELDGSDGSVDALDRWFRENLEADPDSPEDSRRLHRWWYAVVRDIGLWLGDLLIERHPHLQWRLFVWGKRDISYQRPVVMGFKVPETKYNVDFERAVGVTGHRLVRGKTVPDGELPGMLHGAEARAQGNYEL